MEKLTPVLDVLFDEYGVKYGWAGNQAAVYAAPQAIKGRADYDAFFEQLCALPVPETVKVNLGTEEMPKEPLPGVKGLFSRIKTGTVAAAQGLLNKSAVQRQMLFYGIIHFYRNHLQAFIQE